MRRARFRRQGHNQGADGRPCTPVGEAPIHPTFNTDRPRPRNGCGRRTGHPRAALRCPAFRGCLSTRGNTAESAPPLAPLLAVGTSAGYWAVAKGDLSLPAPLRHLKTFGSPPLVTPPDAPLQATPAETALPPIRSRSSMALAAPRLSQPSRAITAASRALRKQAAPSPTVPGPPGRLTLGEDGPAPAPPRRPLPTPRRSSITKMLLLV